MKFEIDPKKVWEHRDEIFGVFMGCSLMMLTGTLVFLVFMIVIHILLTGFK